MHRSMELVSVQYDYEYTAKDGRLVSIKPKECYILVSKSNEHWWQVRKDQHTKPFYVPAQYVKELASLTEDSPGPHKLDSPECVTDSKPVDMAKITPAATIICVSAQGGSRETHRFSTFGFCEDIPDVKPCETPKETQTTNSFAHTPDNMDTYNSIGGLLCTSAPPNTDSLQVYARPRPVPKVRNGHQQSKSSVQDYKVEQTQTFLLDEDMDFPPPPNSPLYDTIPELKVTDFDIFSALPVPVASNETLMFEQQNSRQTAESPSPTDAPSSEEVRFHALLPFSLFSFIILCLTIAQDQNVSLSFYSQERAQFNHVKM